MASILSKGMIFGPFFRHCTVYNVWKAPWSFENLFLNRPMPVKALDDARPGTDRCFMSRTSTSDVYLHKYILHLHRHFTSFLKTKNLNTKMFFSIKQLRMNNMQRTRAMKNLAFLSMCGFHLNNCQSASVFLEQPVSLETWWQNLIIMYTSLHVKICFIRVRCLAGVTYGTRPAL